MVRKRKNSMCILCYKHTTTLSPTILSEHYQFLSVLFKHVKVSKSKEKLLTQTKNELLCCKDCAKLGVSFCEFYASRSGLESGRVLQLNWKVKQVYERMTYGGRVMSRFYKFRKQFVGSEYSQQLCRDVQELRKELMMRCEKVVNSSLPKVYLTRISEQDKQATCAASAVKIEVEETPEVEEFSPLFPEVAQPHSPIITGVQVKTEFTSTPSLNEEKILVRKASNDDKRSVSRSKPLEAVYSKKSTTILANLRVKSETENVEDVSDADDRADPEFKVGQDSEDIHSGSDYEMGSESNDDDDDYEPSRKKRAVTFPTKKASTAKKPKPTSTTKKVVETALSPSTFQCSDCGKVYRKKSRYRRHMNVVHKKASEIEGTLQCSTCEEWFSSQYDLNRHIQSHKRKEEEAAAELTLECSTCSKVFSTKEEYYSHLQSVHKKRIKKLPHESIPKDFNPNECEICHETLDCEAAVEKHRVVKHKLENFVRCHACGKLCSCYNALVEHRTRRLKGTCYTANLEEKQPPAAAPLFPYQKMIFGNKFCPVENCFEVFEHEEVLETHLKAHGTWNCACPQEFSKAHDFAWHELCEHNPKLGKGENVKRSNFKKKDHIEKCEFICSRCDLAFVRRGGVITHFVHAHLDIPKPNIFCKPTSYKYKTKTPPVDLKRGNRKKEPQTSPSGFDCRYCGKEFKGRLSLTIHLKNMHNGMPSGLPGALECDICHERFAYEHSLKRHKNSHVDDDKTECEVCGQKFKNNLYLTRHMNNVHKPPKREWPCKTCGQIFKSRQKVDQHISLKHTDSSEWKFVCPEEGCGRRCFSKQKLMEHIRTHTKERPFVCHVCGESYRYQQSIKTHMAKVHGQLEGKALLKNTLDDAV